MAAARMKSKPRATPGKARGRRTTTAAKPRARPKARVGRKAPARAALKRKAATRPKPRAARVPTPLRASAVVHIDLTKPTAPGLLRAARRRHAMEKDAAEAPPPMVQRAPERHVKLGHHSQRFAWGRDR